MLLVVDEHANGGGLGEFVRRVAFDELHVAFDRDVVVPEVVVDRRRREDHRGSVRIVGRGFGVRIERVGVDLADARDRRLDESRAGFRQLVLGLVGVDRGLCGGDEDVEEVLRELVLGRRLDDAEEDLGRALVLLLDEEQLPKSVAGLLIALAAVYNSARGRDSFFFF